LKVSKRINVTLPDSVLEDLEAWAASQGRSTANLAAFLIEMSIKLAKNNDEFPQGSSVITSRRQS
jgi:CopG-like RHH_1 or ribbon-helix-helix domain, RHH_5